MAKETTGSSSVEMVVDDGPQVEEQLRERINKWVNLENKIAALEEQLREERAEKRDIQDKYLLVRRMGLQMGKGLTEIIEELVSGLLVVKGDGEGDEVDASIPISLNILKRKIVRWDFGEDDYQMLEELKKLFMARGTRKLEEEPENSFGGNRDRDHQSNEMGDSSDDSSRESMPTVVQTLQMVQYKSEVEDGEGDDASSPPEDLIVEPLQDPPLASPSPPGHPKDVDSDSDSSGDSDIAILKEIPFQPPSPVAPRVPTPKNFVLPKITSTFSVAASGSTTAAKEIRGQFTSFSSGSECENEDDDDDPRPSTMATQTKPPMLRRQRQVAMKRTGGFVPKIVKEEDTHSKVPRRSSRSPKPTPKIKTTLKKKRRRQRQRQRQAIQVQDNLNSNPTGHDGSSPPPKKMKKNAQGPAPAIFTPKLTLKPTPAKQLGKDSDSKHYLVEVTSKGCHCACGIISSSKNNLRTHIRRETTELKFKCPVCQLSFLFHSEQKMHLKSAHKVVGDGRKKSLFGCSFCGKVFCKEGKLRKHRATAH